MFYYTILFTAFAIQALFISNITIDYQYSLLFLLFLGSIFIYLFIRKKINIFVIIFIFVSIFPFIQTISYLWLDLEGQFANEIRNGSLDLYGNRLEFWGLGANVYQIDSASISVMMTIATVGSLGIMLGALHNTNREKIEYHVFQFPKKHLIENQSSLANIIYIIWALIVLLIFSLSSSSGTVFDASYTRLSSDNIAVGINFPSLIFVGFILSIFLFSDFLIENNLIKKKFKKYVFISLILTIIFYFQLLRGDRESLTLILGIVLGLFLFVKKEVKINFFLIIKLSILFLFILCLTFLVGFIREYLVGEGLSNIFQIIRSLIEVDLTKSQLQYNNDSLITYATANLFSGTWSGSLLSLISVSGDYVHNSRITHFWTPEKYYSIETNFYYDYGKTYLDYLLSIPPGFFTDLVGYERPLNALSGPAYQMRYGLGGVHLFVVPFLNFGIFGVFFIMYLFSFLITKSFHFFYNNPNVYRLSFILALTVTLPHWIWYGDKYIINSIIITLIVSLIYLISIKVSKVKINL